MRLKLFFIFLLITGSIVAQKSKPEIQNQERIKEIQQSIKKVVDQQDYRTASMLKKEETIRKKMNVSFTNEDYERLAELKKELENCNCIVDLSTANSTQNIKEEASNQSSRDFLFKKEQNKFRNKRFVKYFSFMPIGYIRSSTSAYEYQSTYDESGSFITSNDVFKNTLNDLVGSGLRIGGTIFFNDMKERQKLKIGFDILFVSLTTGIDFSHPGSGVVYFSLGKPGIALKHYLNDYSGFSMRLNVGNAFTVSNVPTLSAIGAEIRLSYWYKNFSLGFEYQFINDVEGEQNSTRINQIGLNCGFQF